MKRERDKILEKLQEQGYKLTPQRKVIVRALVENRDGHLSAEDLLGLVKKAHPEIGLATVYRTLDILAERGILQRMDFGDGRSRYEFNDADLHHHHHLICTKCGRVAEFADDLLETLEDAISQKNGFKIVDHQLKFYGLCQECQRRG